MAGDNSTGTQTQKAEPWSGQQPYLQDIFQEANNIYNSGAGASYFPNSTVVPFSPDTTQGMDMLRNQAGQTPFGLPQAQQSAQNLIGGGQMNRNDVLNQAASGGLQNPLLGGLQNAAGQNTKYGVADISSAAAQDTPYMSDIIRSGSQRTTAGGDVLNATASGDYLNGNPYLDSLFNRAAEGVRDNTNAAFSKAGRYGSAAHSGTLSDSLSGLAANMYGNAYESERARQLGAASELGSRQAADINRQTGAYSTAAGYGSTDISRQLQAGSALAGIEANDLSRQGGILGQLAGFGQQGVQNQLGAAQNINSYGLNQGNQSLAAMGFLPGLDDYSKSGARDLLNLGQMNEGKAGEQLQDQLNRWNFSQQAPWDMLGRYSGIVGGLGSLGGTTTNTGTAPNNPLLGALSGGAGGAGAASALGLSGPWGWGLAGLGALAGAYA